jgi:hypothetical protein
MYIYIIYIYNIYAYIYIICNEGNER